MGRQQLQRHVVEVIIGGTTFVNVLVDTHTNPNYMSLQNRSWRTSAGARQNNWWRKEEIQYYQYTQRTDNRPQYSPFKEKWDYRWGQWGLSNTWSNCYENINNIHWLKICETNTSRIFISKNKCWDRKTRVVVLKWK